MVERGEPMSEMFTANRRRQTLNEEGTLMKAANLYNLLPLALCATLGLASPANAAVPASIAAEGLLSSTGGGRRS